MIVIEVNIVGFFEGLTEIIEGFLDGNKVIILGDFVGVLVGVKVPQPFSSSYPAHNFT